MSFNSLFYNWVNAARLCEACLPLGIDCESRTEQNGEETWVFSLPALQMYSTLTSLGPCYHPQSLTCRQQLDQRAHGRQEQQALALTQPRAMELLGNFVWVWGTQPRWLVGLMLSALAPKSQPDATLGPHALQVRCCHWQRYLGWPHLAPWGHDTSRPPKKTCTQITCILCRLAEQSIKLDDSHKVAWGMTNTCISSKLKGFTPNSKSMKRNGKKDKKHAFWSRHRRSCHTNCTSIPLIHFGRTRSTHCKTRPAILFSNSNYMFLVILIL